MPEKTPGQIKADAAEYIRENGSKEILPTAIRNSINDICDSFLARDYGDGAKLPVATTVDELIGQQSDGTVVRIADDALATQVGALVTPALNASVSAAAGSAAAAAAARDAALFGKGVFPSTAAALGLGVIGHGPITGGSGGTNGTFALAFTGGTGSGAAGRFVVAGGALVAIFITAPGAYTVAPTFSFAASSGLTGASATAVLGVNADVGEYFSVPAGAETLDLYRVDAGPVATHVMPYPAKDYIDKQTSSEIVTVENKMIRSEELDNAIWTKSGVTISANSAVGPDGLSGLDKIQEDTSTGGHTVVKSIPAVAAGTRITASWYVRAAERTKFRVTVTNASNVFAFSFDAVDKTTTQVGLTLDAISAFEEVSAGLFRCSVSYIVIDGAATNLMYLQLVDGAGNTSYTGVAGNGVHAGYFQASYDYVPQPYVKTTAAAASKSFALRKPYIRRYVGNTSGFGVPDDDKICYLFAGGGQSNQDGQGTDSLVASSALYPGQALMLGGTLWGPHAKNSSYAGVSDLVEVIAGASRETICSGFASATIAKIKSETSKDIRILPFIHAIGAQTYQQLKRGAVGSSIILKSYRWFLVALEDACRIARANGWRPVFFAYNWMGNEGNWNTDAETWATFMTQNYRMMDEDIRRLTGQTENWVYFIDQVSHVGSSANASAFAPTIVEGNRLAALRNSNIKLGNPTYHLERSAASNAIHFSCVGQNWRGQALARAVCAEVFGTGYEPFAMRKAYRSGAAQITVEFTGSMAGNLVMDTSDAIVTSTGLPSGNYYGFRFDDRSGASPSISGHSISGRSLILTLSATPSANHAWRLAYATERNPSVITDGPATGARGCLRLDTAHSMLYSLSDDYDWCHPGILEVAK